MSKAKHDPADILKCADDLERLVDALPAVDHANWDTSRQKRFDAINALITHLNNHPKWRVTAADDWRGARVSMFGIRATCTAGFEGACRNWIAQARRKMETQKAETAETVFVYCGRNGVISYSENPQEQGLVRLAAGKPDEVKPIVEVLARHAYDGRTLLVPGIPEATTDHEAHAAARRFIAQFDEQRAAK